MSLPKCPSHDSLEDLDELYDAEVNNSVNSEPDDRVEEVTSGSEGRGACVEQCESDDEVESEDEETESEGKEVESESEETEVSEVLERPNVVMALGVHDGTHRGISRTRVPRCRVVDIGTCDSILTREQLAIIRRTFNVPPPISSFFRLWVVGLGRLLTVFYRICYLF
ncbi:UNVERIFIED_CONTAM: hypothetical protein Sradi_2690700 [Sesamum radiatum]|uniref:Uncharacterized protein n=1 Tax=Sesamum radiatum TaxID=300843 RepID=A0AAW2S6Q2_SESRA